MEVAVKKQPLKGASTIDAKYLKVGRWLARAWNGYAAMSAASLTPVSDSLHNDMFVWSTLGCRWYGCAPGALARAHGAWQCRTVMSWRFRPPVACMPTALALPPAPCSERAGGPRPHVPREPYSIPRRLCAWRLPVHRSVALSCLCTPHRVPAVCPPKALCLPVQLPVTPLMSSIACTTPLHACTTA